jgi:hypothetical protein
MGSLGGAGRHTTALVGREVKRTFSEFGRFSTGLPGFKAAEASCQNAGNFDQMSVWAVGMHTPLNGERLAHVHDFT